MACRPMLPSLLLWCALLLNPTAAIQEKALENWLSSQSGLMMKPTDAADLAEKSWAALTQCDVTVPILQALRNVMIDPKGMAMDMYTITQNIMLLAEQHVKAERLSSFWTALTSGYTMSGGLSLPWFEAQTYALGLSRARAEVDQLYALYKVMYGYSGLGFDQRTAQHTAISLTFAGADAQTYQDAYTKAKPTGQPAAMRTAAASAVNANFKGLVQRYAKDATLYSAPEFQQHYSGGWLDEWLTAPVEFKVSSDGQEYTAGQFFRHYGSSWDTKYKVAPEADQKRLANDGKAYTIWDFQKYYGAATWQKTWGDSPEVPCTQCAPYPQEEAQQQQQQKEQQVVAAEVVV